MAIHLLSALAVKRASNGDHSDGGGLMLRIRHASASWVFRYTSPTGRRREMGLGTARRANDAQAGESLKTARDLAAKARDLLQREIDPIEDRQRQRDSEREEEHKHKAEKVRERTTLARAARAYHERVIEPKRTTKHSAQWIASLENHVPPDIWHAPIASIDAPMLYAALTKVRALDDKSKSVPETLHRVRQRLDAVFEDAVFHGHCVKNPAAAIRRKIREDEGKRKRGKFKALAYREIPAFMARLRAQPGTAARCLEFAVLTASRTSEALLAKWSEFDLEAGIWIIPAERMKADEPHTVYLSAGALAILESQRGMHADIVFPSPMLENKPMSNMAMLAVLDRMGARDRTTVHGLCRATFSTWANDTNAARPDVIETCLAHDEENRVRAAYNRAEFLQERKELMDAWCQYLSQSAKVLPLRAA